MNTKQTSLFIAFFVMMVLGGVIKTDSSTAACDRECLTGFMTTYINAMLNHKPDSLPVADSVRVTEDSKEIKIGEGYWKDISGSNVRNFTYSNPQCNRRTPGQRRRVIRHQRQFINPLCRTIENR